VRHYSQNGFGGYLAYSSSDYYWTLDIKDGFIALVVLLANGILEANVKGFLPLP
jgi:hypothetical protein